MEKRSSFLVCAATATYGLEGGDHREGVGEEGV